MKGIVIGAGYSWHKYKDDLSYKLKNMIDDNYLVFTTDRTLKDCIKFCDPSKIIVATNEETSIYNNVGEHRNSIHTFEEFYNLPYDIAKDIRVHLSCQVTMHLINLIKSRGFQIMQDFHRFTLRCIRTIPKDCITLREGYNIGMTMICIASQIYNIKDIATIGIDFTPYDEDLPGNENYAWQGEFEHSLLAVGDLMKNDVMIHNCNPNNIGRFCLPLIRSSLENFRLA